MICEDPYYNIGDACSRDAQCLPGLECRDDICLVPLKTLEEECMETEECEP